jgi:hypothetical protein
VLVQSVRLARQVAGTINRCEGLMFAGIGLIVHNFGRPLFIQIQSHTAAAGELICAISK